MGNGLDNHELAKRFLLGNLSESERVKIEDGFLEQDDFYQELLVAEDDLIDAYVRGELPAHERALFEQRRLTSPHSRERVEFARTLFESVSASSVLGPVPDRPASWWSFGAGGLLIRRPAIGLAFAAVLLVLMLAGLWFGLDRWRIRPAPEQAKGIQPMPITPPESPAPIRPAEEPHVARNEERPPAKETPTVRPPVLPVIATFALLPGLARGSSGAGALVLPAGATEVRLRLVLEGEAYKTYRAVLSTPEGRRVSSRDVTNGPAAKSANLTLTFPAELFSSGDYVLDLSGANTPGNWESVADYSFRIVKK